MTDETKAELYTEAQALEIEGRSTMDKDELAAAVEAAKSADPGVEEAAEEFSKKVDELDESNEEPKSEVPRAKYTQGGLTVITN